VKHMSYTNIELMICGLTFLLISYKQCNHLKLASVEFLEESYLRLRWDTHHVTVL
jgi:hypothetical protein